MEFLLATQELSEMNYPADTVEVALGYTNTEKAKVPFDIILRALTMARFLKLMY